ncbi:hypothetical protein ABZT48_41840 [Streptomyces avermitilis]|uniref:hypothetical protein n=1 Tax=Streptomyces avermitilis TaxID=33903 RepID=UPI0033B8DDC5
MHERGLEQVQGKHRGHGRGARVRLGLVLLFVNIALKSSGYTPSADPGGGAT